ncbi:MAG: B12-binding domain-containing radical SAM protein [Oligoflexia bacterium]
MRLLLMTPPMTQLNTPYPATAYLKGFLRKHRPDLDVRQEDPALELVLELFSRAGLVRIRDCLLARKELRTSKSRAIAVFLSKFEDYLQTIEPAVRFLQGRDPSLALRIVSRQFLPEGPSFDALAQYAVLSDSGSDFRTDELNWAFGALGVQDRAKYLATLFLDDLALVIREGFDERFAFSRYGEKLAASQASFDPLHSALESSTPTLIDQILDAITDRLMNLHRPDLVGLTAPFPGNVYGAFRMARRIKATFPGTWTCLGGGYVNTELRELSEPRVFDYFDYITVDDGERPLLSIIARVEEGLRQGANRCDPGGALLRTFVRSKWAGPLGGTGPEARVEWVSDSRLHDFPQRDVGAPDYEGLHLDQYLSLVEMLNPMHRIWSDGRWNKLTLAHGCYWKKCSFCDVSLDYIGRYDPVSADLIIDRMIAVSKQTGQTGFHFVDEAAPPALLKNLSQRLLERGESFSWWGNVRFDQAFTPELAALMAKAGCIAVSGGLEAASDRLLKLMNKGVSVEQVARVTRAFSDAGILVHAYLMYGFPTQTEQETLDALERVRQLFAEGCIQSAYWHRFSTTVHSPVGKNPEAYGIQILEKPLAQGAHRFARNDLEFEDPTPADHHWLGEGLRRALYNYMHGLGLDQDVRNWFTPRGSRVGRVPGLKRAQVDPDLIRDAILQKKGSPKQTPKRLRND